jgi:hypothetical protein
MRSFVPHCLLDRFLFIADLNSPLYSLSPFVLYPRQSAADGDDSLKAIGDDIPRLILREIRWLEHLKGEPWVLDAGPPPPLPGTPLEADTEHYPPDSMHHLRRALSNG